MSSTDPNEVVLQGAASWNAWRREYPAPVHFARPHWYDCPDASGVEVKGFNRLDFSGMEFVGVSIYAAFAEGLNADNTLFDDCHFDEGDFSRASFSGAKFRNTRFNKTIFTGANFCDADFVNCNLNRVNLTGADFRVGSIRETVVYGVSAWDLMIDEGSEQSRLVVEKTYDLYSDLIAQQKIPLMVDDIELAQFIYYLSSHRKMRDTLNIFNDRGVLLLGRFEDGGIERLHRIATWFRQRGYMPMIFDFARPDSLSFTETIVTMAGLAKFIVADLSGPSVPAELGGTLKDLHKPVLAFGKAYALFPDLQDTTTVIAVKADDDRLLKKLEKKLPKLEKLHARRIRQLAKRYSRSKE